MLILDLFTMKEFGQIKISHFNLIDRKIDLSWLYTNIYILKKYILL